MPDEPTDKPEKSAETPKTDEPTPAVEAEGSEDALRPDVIAKRVERALGQETDLERVAREEEQKLIERKRALKKKGKTGLEAAASKRLAKIGEKAATVKRPSTTIATAADADPLLERAARLTRWLRKNAAVMRGAVAVAVVAALGVSVYAYMQKKKNTEASVILTEGVADEQAQFANPARPHDDDDDEEDRPKSPYPTFKTPEAGRDAALAKFREVESKFSGTGAAFLARLAEGSILLDKADLDGAQKAFEDVKASPLAQEDNEVKGRTLEGLGFAHEAKADKADKAEDARKVELDQALKAYRELELAEGEGFKELGLYHQARIFEKQGDKAKAIELLKTDHERVTKPGENQPYPYLQFVVEDRLRALDPTAVPPKTMGGGLGGPGGRIDMSDPRIQEFMRKYQEQMQKKQQEGKP